MFCGSFPSLPLQVSPSQAALSLLLQLLVVVVILITIITTIPDWAKEGRDKEGDEDEDEGEDDVMRWWRGGTLPADRPGRRKEATRRARATRQIMPK